MTENLAPNLSPVEKAVLDAIDLDDMLLFLDELVAIRSLDGEETPAQRRVAAQMRALGLAVDEWEIDLERVRQHPAYCEEVVRDSGVGVVGSMGAGNGRSLILNGHVDVVPAGNLANWTVDPWRATVVDGNVYGRGALDMKGALCCALYAAKAIQDAGVSLAGRLLLQSVIGEEDGGVGTLATTLRGYTADAAIVLEPTELMVAPAQAGALNFRITVPGKAAHGAVRTEGVNPIEKLFPIYWALVDLEARRGRTIQDPRFAAYDVPYAICVGTIRGGVWASTVPESVTIEGRYGIGVAEDLAAARRELEAAVAQAAAADPWLRENRPVVAWWGAQFEAAGIDPDHPIVHTVRDAYADVTGAPPQQQGMTYGADMRLLVHYANTPTILFGPGDVRKAHQPDEFVPLPDLERTVQTVALTAVRFCGVVP